MIDQIESQRLAAACLIALLDGVHGSAADHDGNRVANVKDSTGGVVPGATVASISETAAPSPRPLPTRPGTTCSRTTAGIYTVEVTMDGFRTVRRTGIQVSGADRVAVPSLTLEPGGAAETVNVTSEAPSFRRRRANVRAISQVQIENLPVPHRGSFTAFTSFTPASSPAARRPAAPASAAPARTTS